MPPLPTSQKPQKKAPVKKTAATPTDIRIPGAAPGDRALDLAGPPTGSREMFVPVRTAEQIVRDARTPQELAVHLVGPQGAEVAGEVTGTYVMAASDNDDAAGLASAVVQVIAAWGKGRKRVDEAEVELLRAEAFKNGAESMKDAAAREIKAALDLASDAEAKATAAERAREQAERKGAETGRQLTQALADRDEAQAKARQLEAAIAPLRTLLGSTA